MIWQFDMAGQVFWLLAALNISLSVRVLTLPNSRPGSSASHSALAAGQKQDACLLAALMFCGFWIGYSDFGDFVMLIMLPVLVWLLKRATQRLRLRP